MFNVVSYNDLFYYESFIGPWVFRFESIASTSKCYQRRSTSQDPAGNWTKRRPPDDRKETQTVVVWSCFPFIRSGQNHLAKHSERGEEDKADRGRGGKTTSGNGQAWSSAGPRGRWRTGENGENWLKNHL